MSELKSCSWPDCGCALPPCPTGVGPFTPPPELPLTEAQIEEMARRDSGGDLLDWSKPENLGATSAQRAAFRRGVRAALAAIGVEASNEWKPGATVRVNASRIEAFSPEAKAALGVTSNGHPSTRPSSVEGGEASCAGQFCDCGAGCLKPAAAGVGVDDATSHMNCLEARRIDRAYAICEPCNTGFPERCLYKRPSGVPAQAGELPDLPSSIEYLVRHFPGDRAAILAWGRACQGAHGVKGLDDAQQ